MAMSSKEYARRPRLARAISISVLPGQGYRERRREGPARGRATRPSVDLSDQGQEHHVEPDERAVRAPERTWHGADDLEAQRLPQAHGCDVGLDDRVELEAAEPAVTVPRDDMLAERAADAATAGRRTDHERGGADVGTL